jgi:hypothetical protein
MADALLPGESMTPPVACTRNDAMSNQTKYLPMLIALKP